MCVSVCVAEVLVSLKKKSKDESPVTNKGKLCIFLSSHFLLTKN